MVTLIDKVLVKKEVNIKTPSYYISSRRGDNNGEEKTLLAITDTHFIQATVRKTRWDDIIHCELRRTEITKETGIWFDLTDETTEENYNRHLNEVKNYLAL